MKKIGIALLLFWPALMIAAGLYSSLAPQWYYSTAFIEKGDANMDAVNRAFAEITPKPANVTVAPVTNTDLLEIKARDLKSQIAADNANSVAKALSEKLPAREGKFPRIMAPAEPAPVPDARLVVWANVLGAGVLGLFPATVGLILILLGRSNRSAGTPAIRQAA